MTYHLVTKEELERVRYDDDCSEIVNRILIRPDPLEILEMYFKHREIPTSGAKQLVYSTILGKIKELRTQEHP